MSNCKIEKGNLVLDVSDLLSSITGEARKELIQALACEDSILAEVASQIITGWTSDGWSSGRSCSWSIDPWCALDVAIRRVAEASGEVAKKEIERANREIEGLKEKMKNEESRYSRIISRFETLQYEVKRALEYELKYDGLHYRLQGVLKQSEVNHVE
jgi:uncharacterized tellurite resistance protein B-like protein